MRLERDWKVEIWTIEVDEGEERKTLNETGKERGGETEREERINLNSEMKVMC